MAELGAAYWNLVDAVEGFRDAILRSEFSAGGLSMLTRDMRFIKDLAVIHGVDTERRPDGS